VALVLTLGILEPYVPTVIGPDGTVYTLNGGTLFALGHVPNVNVSLWSSAPDLRTTDVGTTVTFTANVGGSAPTPTGTVTFTDITFNGLTPVATTLASNVPLTSGQASVTTSSLAAGGGFLGNHFITAAYSGDAGHPASSVTMVQKVHANGSTAVVVAFPGPSSFGQAVSFTATVSSVPAGAGTPTGMVTFHDGPTVIGQVPLNSSGVASITRSNLTPGLHGIVATYASATQFAASVSSVAHVVQNGTSTTVSSSSNPSSFGQLVMFTATLMAANAVPGIPTGSVAFKDGDTVLATVQLDGTAHASFATSALSIGSHTITADFTGTNGWLNSSGVVVQAVEDGPLLFTEENTQSAVAPDLVTQMRDPFSLTNQYNVSPDLRRRVSLFVWRLGLLPTDNASNVTVLAEDDQGRVYNLAVEYVGPSPGLAEVTQVVVRLPDSVVGAPRDLWLKVSLRGPFSNRGIIRIATP
jgi:Big-like domain-containing protein